uniref:Endoribonuclease L-PSP/chorismate mutase-like domain-containing protein n=1 Tax=Heterosigma akashiwo TaxID=2829 RepID=A0A6V1UA49_HETAK|mmetsp:Transcript_13586/g.20647  ORF Transcript_13586/g.20647 Transcript_13586/m.20647 type:complete len:178 (-) Transcript_13586:174-707(-)
MFSLVRRANGVISKSSVLVNTARQIHIEQRIEELGYKLPEMKPPAGNFVLVKRIGNLLYTAGHLPQPADGDLMLGKVGEDVDMDTAYKAAQCVGLNILATVKAEVGDLDRVRNVVKLMGFVNCPDGFRAQPQVVNGCSDLMVEIFGDKGRHSRSAVGTNALPLNVPVEIEAIFEVED